jgi:amino acid adenylation domain-containing protein
VVTGIVSNGRPEAEGSDRVLGLFLNTLPLRVAVASEPWLALVHRCFRAELEGLAFRRYPLPAIQRLCGADSLFEAAFNYTDFHALGDLDEVGGADYVETQTFEQTNFVYLLNASVERRKQEIAFTIEGKPGELGEQQLRLMGGYTQAALQQMSDELNSDCLQFPLLSAAERHRLENDYNDTAASFPSERLIHELFETRAALHPAELAVLCGDQQICYGDLNERSNRLARRLREVNVTRGEVVAVYTDRSVATVIAVLGILKAGGAYVPIDPELPADRVTYLIRDSGAKTVVVNAGWKVASFDGTVIDLDQPSAFAADGSNLRSENKPSDLAYLIYTSGSTGQPKAAAMEHRGVVNTIWDVNTRFDVGRGDRILGISSLAFDLSVYDIFGALAAGATVVIVQLQKRRDPAAWLKTLQDQHVTIWNTVPALMQLLVDEAEGFPGGVASALRLVLMSGDWIPVSLPERVRALWPDSEVISMGGATEASIWSIIYPIGVVNPRWPSIPYGRPMKNQSYYVYNSRLQTCPTGVPGDLYIGGIGVARGYHNNDEKNHTSFVVHPETGERLYRTGDLGRHLPCGEIEFLGRADFQVKIQGNRIELGEIETALRRVFGVREAVVVALGQRDQDRSLCAYYLGNPTSSDDFRRELGEILPAHMVPATFVHLEKFPLSANGKLDRKALPAPVPIPVEERILIAPRTITEAAVAEIWQEVLKQPRIGIDDNFFAIGGHSLAAVRIASLIRKRLQCELPLRVVFEGATVAQIAEYLDKARSDHSAMAATVAANVETGEL